MLKIKVKCECGKETAYEKFGESIVTMAGVLQDRMYAPLDPLTETVDIELGMLFGYKMVLKDVPEERAKHVEKLAKKHMERMEEAYRKDTFGAFDRDMEIVRVLRGK